MRIGIFTDSYYPHISGVATSIEMLKEALIAMGHKVYIVAPNLDNYKFIYEKDKCIIRLPGIKTGVYKLRITGIYSAKAMQIIKNEWKLDIIHSQTEASVGTFANIVAKRLNIPVVQTYHTLYEDYAYYITHGHFNNIVKKGIVRYTKYYYNHKCDELIVPTEKIKDIFENRYHIKRKVHVIPTGIDTKKLYPTLTLKKKAKELRKKYKINEEDFIIGSVGRVASEKSFDKIIKNLCELVKMNNKIKFLLIGDGPQTDELKELATKLKVDKNVIFTGLVDYDLMPAFYQVFDVMVSFSKTETQGLTIIEALAATKPVVCIDDISFRSMVQNKYNGFIFKNNEEYKKAILDLVYDKQLYKTMSMNAKNSTYSYSKEVFASNILKVYHEAIDKKKSKKETD